MDRQGCLVCCLWEHRAVGALGVGGNAVPCSAEPPAGAKALPHAGLAAAKPLSLKAEESESQCWGEDSALIIKSPSKKS